MDQGGLVPEALKPKEFTLREVDTTLPQIMSAYLQLEKKSQQIIESVTDKVYKYHKIYQVN